MNQLLQQLLQTNFNQKLLYFEYVIESDEMTAIGDTNVQSKTLAADSYFELHAILGSSSDDDANDPSPNNFSVQITDTSTGRSFSDDRVPQRLICSNSNNFMAMERRPILFPPNAILTFDFEALAATVTATIVLKGYKHFLG